MSVTVHQILNDAKRLVNQLRDQESTADKVISQTNVLCTNVEAMKEYTGDEQVKTVSRPLLFFNVQQKDNKHIMELVQENRELSELLEEHQSALELIMSKYRQQITNLVKSSTEATSHTQSSQELQQLADTICEIAGVMQESVKLDDAFRAQEQEKLSSLMVENKGLRELLQISRTYGSLIKPLNMPETTDKEIQTD